MPAVRANDDPFGDLFQGTSASMPRRTHIADLPWSGPEPTLADFQALTEAAFERLPRKFRDMCGDLVIRVEDWPDDETLDAMRIDSPYGLLGLYHGVSLNHKSTMSVPYGPDMVFLYRRPILRYIADRGDSVEAVVTHVLVHEIGHHFGLSDADMEAIEDSAA
jgi:predicted Zn-dependent protease with MMP-like domain